MKIGKYKLTLKYDNHDSFLNDDCVCITKEDGEGGVFMKHELFKKLEAVIDEFYKENL